MTTFWKERWPAPYHPLIERAFSEAEPDEILALDFDNTCVEGDTGELFHLHMSTHLGWNLAEFARHIAPSDGQSELLLAIDRFQGGALDARAELFRCLMDAFPRRMERTGPAATYAWSLTLHAGIREDAHRAHGRLMLEREASLTRERVVISRPRTGEAPLMIRRGVRSRPAFRALIQAAQAEGIAPWVVSATNQWTVEIAAEDFGIPPERVIGNRSRVVDGVITSEREGVTTYRDGKVEALDRLGLRVALAAGDSWSDVPMMERARYAILVDRGDAELRAYGNERGWAVVPAEAFSSEAWGAHLGAR